MESIAQYLLYAGAVGFPSFFVLRWMYSQWLKANLPAFWAWVLQQRRRDKTIRATREKVDDLEGRLAELEKITRPSVTVKENEESDDITTRLDDVLNRLGSIERMVAQLRHRLRSKGIMTDA